MLLQDEQHDPLLNSFAQLKEALQSVAGRVIGVEQYLGKYSTKFQYSSTEALDISVSILLLSKILNWIKNMINFQRSMCIKMA